MLTTAISGDAGRRAARIRRSRRDRMWGGEATLISMRSRLSARCSPRCRAATKPAASISASGALLQRRSRPSICGASMSASKASGSNGGSMRTSLRSTCGARTCRSRPAIQMADGDPSSYLFFTGQCCRAAAMLRHRGERALAGDRADRDRRLRSDCCAPLFGLPTDGVESSDRDQRTRPSTSSRSMRHGGIRWVGWRASTWRRSTITTSTCRRTINEPTLIRSRI